ncbi:MAG: hypothetical protein CVU43_09730 [Chloroflexi bacterium HGW-Chloroflexi-5]|jgi:hypothetical protein|nr:MAG: hypothetical protein CVU43_09730 [Chloroflexi bacterium HGW-Chloroflexi-5]
MTTYTSQPAESDGLDSYYSEGSPTSNNGTSDKFYIGNSSKNRGILKFDLTKGTNPPPTGAIVIGTPQIELYCGGYRTSKTLAAYECLKNWVESQVTWNIYSTGNNWDTAGGDYDATALGSVAVSSTGTKTITLPTSIVQKWIDTQNFGVILKHTSEADNTNDYVSSSGATASERPKLTFEYTTSSRKSVLGVLSASIKKIAGVAIASVKKVGGVA